MTNEKRKFDLAERTEVYGEKIIRFSREIRLDPVSSPLVRQLVRSATSMGANYGEADEAGSKQEFRYRISLCSRESRECRHWLRMLVVACPDKKTAARELWKEANELNKIFATIFRRSKPK